MNPLKKAIDEIMLKYDEEVGLIKDFYTPNYHSYLKPGEYYKINTATNVAAAIFSVGYKKYYSAAKKMLEMVSSLQCKEGKNAGLWSYFYEESIEQMVKPDWNMADFNAYPMIYILKEHKDNISKELYDSVADACVLACKAMIRRNLTVVYTNPTVMGIYCTVVCGELLGIDEFIQYGKHKLEKFYFRIMNMGTYDEYNCPNYSLLIANMYSLILRHFTDKEMLKKAEDLNNIVWKMLGEHYHKELNEFTGPNLRQYTNFSPEMNTINALVSGENDKMTGFLDLIYSTKCPEQFKSLFMEDNKSADFMRVISLGFNYPYLGWPEVDIQHIRPRYTLGANSMCDCWNQRRNVVAYIGDKDKKVCIRLRAYHNNYDFCSAFTSTAQQGNVALSLTNFHTDRGDTHVDLDPVINATIKASKLNVLYQIEANCDGIIENIKTEQNKNSCRLEIMGTKVEIAFPFIEATGLNPQFEISSKDKEMFVSANLYTGEEKEINLKALESLVVVSVISIDNYLQEETQIEKDDEVLTASVKVKDDLLTVKGPYKPLKQAHSVLLNEVLINGENIIKLAETKG